MALLLDLHVAAQAFLYFFSVACSLVVCIPLGVTQINMDNQCLLYTDVSWTNATWFVYTPGSLSTCRFPIYMTVFVGIIYSTIVGVYYIYALCQKDPNIGTQMWVWPFSLVSLLITCAIFITACIISVGFKTFCDGLEKGVNIHSCADAETNWVWHDTNGGTLNSATYYHYVHASEGAAWVLFLCWVVQFGLGLLRIIRNRRLRSQGMYADTPEGMVSGAGDKKPEDLTNIAAANPSA